MDKVLDLERLRAGLPPGVTPVFGAFVAEAASVVLAHNNHGSGVTFRVKADRARRYSLVWPVPHPDAQRSHNDLPAAAEQGAYGIAFLLAEELTTFKIIERSRKGTGFDYYLGTGDEYPFQAAARLEVSGIVGNTGAVSSRVRQKVRQTTRSDGALPAFVAVVEFGKPLGVWKKR